MLGDEGSKARLYRSPIEVTMERPAVVRQKLMLEALVSQNGPERHPPRRSGGQLTKVMQKCGSSWVSAGLQRSLMDVDQRALASFLMNSSAADGVWTVGFSCI